MIRQRSLSVKWLGSGSRVALAVCALISFGCASTHEHVSWGRAIGTPPDSEAVHVDLDLPGTYRIVALSTLPPGPLFSAGREGVLLRLAIAVIVSALICVLLARSITGRFRTRSADRSTGIPSRIEKSVRPPHSRFSSSSIREIATQFQLVQFLYVMSLSLENGVPLLDALRSCREIARSDSFRRFIGSLEEGVNEGRGIAAGFRKADYLPPLVAQMVATGEESGRLATVMGRMADFYEREWRKKLTLVAKIVEPSMLLLMGAVVGLIVSSLLLPIFKLSAAIH